MYSLSANSMKLIPFVLDARPRPRSSTSQSGVVLVLEARETSSSSKFCVLLKDCPRPRSPSSHSRTVLVLEDRKVGSSSKLVFVLEGRTRPRSSALHSETVLVLETRKVGSLEYFDVKIIPRSTLRRIINTSESRNSITISTSEVS